MNERRNVPEIVIAILRIASQIPNSDRSPLYDVKNPACASVRSIHAKCYSRGRSIQGLDLQFPSGGARRDRTDDLMLAKHALSQLSYGPVPEDECFYRARCALAFAGTTAQQPSFKEACRAKAAEQRRLVGLGRLELPTSRLSSARSNQLSY